MRCVNSWYQEKGAAWISWKPLKHQEILQSLGQAQGWVSGIKETAGGATLGEAGI